MKFLQTSLVLFIALTAFSVTASAQNTAASPKPAHTPVKEVVAVQAPKPLSLTALKPGERFVSESGRFSIAAPSDITYKFFENKENFDEEAGDSAGKTASWRVKEGALVVGYLDNPAFTLLFEKDFSAMTNGIRSSVIKAGKLISEKTITQSGYKGYEIIFEDKLGMSLTRAFPVGDRLYTLLVISDPEVPGSFEEMQKALDSLVITGPPAKK